MKVDVITDKPSLNLSLDTIKKDKQALVFVNTKRGAEKTAEDIASKVKLENADLINLSEKVMHSLANPTKQCKRLSMCVKKGIAFHHAGLTSGQRELIEDSFRKKTLKIICCTPTLAAGIDLPAYRTIIKDLKRYGGRWGSYFIPVLEYLQMAGRAGRPKYDKFGETICIAMNKDQKESIYETYIIGEPEEIYSKLAVEPVLRTYILSIVAAGFVTTKKSILEFFEKTFWAHQYKDMDKLEEIIIRMIDLLDEYEFIRVSSKQAFISASEIDDEKIKATLLGKRVAELYIDPLTAHQIINALKRSQKMIINEFTLLQMVCNKNEMHPLLKVKAKDHEDIREKLVKHEDSLIELEPSMYNPDYGDFLNSVKTALFMHDWIGEQGEEYLMEKYDIRPGEIRAKLNLADWLLYATEELSRILGFNKILKEIKKTRFRLKYGVKEELLALLKLKGIGRVRARKLFRNRIRDLGDVKKSDVMKLIQILGRKVAIDIKKQIGQDFENMKVRENKRKGQISLNDF